MSLNVGGLTAYVSENKMPLISKAVLGANEIDFMTIQPGIKSSEAINIIDSTLAVQAGACSWVASGTTALSHRLLAVCDLKVNEAICQKTLAGYYTQYMLKAGAKDGIDTPFEQAFVEEKAKKISEAVSYNIWQGGYSPTTGTTSYPNCSSSILNTLVNTSDSASTVSFTSATTASNIIAVVQAMVTSLPVDVMDRNDLVIFASPAFFNTFRMAVVNANLYHYTGEVNGYSILVPGTNVTLVATKGLTSSNYAIATYSANIFFGTDMLSDSENFDFWYSQDNLEHRFAADWRQAANVAFPSQVVVAKVSL